MIDIEDEAEAHAQRQMIGHYSIVRQYLQKRQFYRRTWSRVREDGADVAVLCFVQCGSVRVTHRCGENVAKEGDFFIVKSKAPITIESVPGEHGRCELLHVTCPHARVAKPLGHYWSSQDFVDTFTKVMQLPEERSAQEIADHRRSAQVRIHQIAPERAQRPDDVPVAGRCDQRLLRMAKKACF